VIRSIRAISPSVEKATAALDPNELIRETIVLARNDLEKEGISIKLGLAPKLFPVLGHRGQLQQVILNLVNNAVDAMRLVNDRERILTVKSESLAPDGIAITVEDSGTGIDPKNVDQMFDAFFTTKSKGMGMGLAICRSMVEAHGGRMWASNNESRGAVFRFTLPLEQDESVSAQQLRPNSAA
jgi:signal transduction histidine kinase